MKSAFTRLLRTILVGALLSSAGCATAPRPPLVTDTPQAFPTEPAPNEVYRITTSDELRVTVYRQGDFSTLFDLSQVSVLPDGTISVPLIGDVTAAGLTPDQLRDTIASRLDKVLIGDGPYRIQPSDQLRITVYRQSDMSALFDVNPVVLPDGKILAPVVGEITASGLTPEQLRDEISGRLGDVLVKPVVNVAVNPNRPRVVPIVSISIKGTRPKVYVLGEVRNPGVYRIERDTTAVEVLALAGGMTGDADLSSIVLLRTTKLEATAPPLATVSLDELFQKADVRQNVVLRGGDILLVPPDHIARANRVLQYVSNIVAPFAQIFGVISQVFILSRLSRVGTE